MPDTPDKNPQDDEEDNGNDENRALLPGHRVREDRVVVDRNGPIPFWPFPVPPDAITRELHSRTVRLLCWQLPHVRLCYRHYFQSGGHVKKKIYKTVFALDENLRHIHVRVVASRPLPNQLESHT